MFQVGRSVRYPKEQLIGFRSTQSYEAQLTRKSQFANVMEKIEVCLFVSEVEFHLIALAQLGLLGDLTELHLARLPLLSPLAQLKESVIGRLP